MEDVKRMQDLKHEKLAGLSPEITRKTNFVDEKLGHRLLVHINQVLTKNLLPSISFVRIQSQPHKFGTRPTWVLPAVDRLKFILEGMVDKS